MENIGGNESLSSVKNSGDDEPLLNRLKCQGRVNSGGNRCFYLASTGQYFVLIQLET